MIRRIALLAIAFVVTVPVWAGDWPAWRGPDGTGITTEKGLPVKWSRTENIRWQTPLPERGNSTPIVCGDRVFITQAIEKEGRRTLMCLDRSNGKLDRKRPEKGSGVFC